jgi:hypothetical protein
MLAMMTPPIARVVLEPKQTFLLAL